MDLGLKDQVALVGASSKGLGKAIALGLAEEGAKVTICARGRGYAGGDSRWKFAKKRRQKSWQSQRMSVNRSRLAG